MLSFNPPWEVSVQDNSSPSSAIRGGRDWDKAFLYRHVMFIITDIPNSQMWKLRFKRLKNLNSQEEAENLIPS
jgi:hypothetical protein